MRSFGLDRRNPPGSPKAYLFLDALRFLGAVFPGLIPAFRSHHLSALFNWHLAAFFDWHFNALLGGNLPATDLRNVGANLLGNGATTLLRHLMASRVSDRGANALGTLTALGAWFLPARHHW